jgi:hypothetical protein
MYCWDVGKHDFRASFLLKDSQKGFFQCLFGGAVVGEQPVLFR